MAKNKRILYVGGLVEEVTEATLQAAFIPFGDLAEVTIPLDHSTQKHRGFGFVRFEDVEDAEAAQDNMHNSELFGRVITVNVARALSGKLGGNKAIWADADEWEARLKEDGLATQTELEAQEKANAAPFDTLTPGTASAPAAAATGASPPPPGPRGVCSCRQRVADKLAAVRVLPRAHSGLCVNSVLLTRHCTHTPSPHTAQLPRGELPVAGRQAGVVRKLGQGPEQVCFTAQQAAG